MVSLKPSCTLLNSWTTCLWSWVQAVHQRLLVVTLMLNLTNFGVPWFKCYTGENLKDPKIPLTSNTSMSTQSDTTPPCMKISGQLYWRSSQVNVLIFQSMWRLLNSLLWVSEALRQADLISVSQKFWLKNPKLGYYIVLFIIHILSFLSIYTEKGVLSRVYLSSVAVVFFW